jgi:hypothetical protein
VPVESVRLKQGEKVVMPSGRIAYVRQLLRHEVEFIYHAPRKDGDSDEDYTFRLSRKLVQKLFP